MSSVRLWNKRLRVAMFWVVYLFIGELSILRNSLPQKQRIFNLLFHLAIIIFSVQHSTMWIKLWGSVTSSCTHRVLITLNELGIKYNLTQVNLMKGDQNMKVPSCCLLNVYPHIFMHEIEVLTFCTRIPPTFRNNTPLAAYPLFFMEISNSSNPEPSAATSSPSLAVPLARLMPS